MADRLPLILDWDNTLVHWNDGQDGEWIDGAPEFLRWCKRQGWKLVVASARANYPEGKAEIEAKLKAARHGDVKVFPKPLGFAYVDDKAVPAAGNWSAVRERVRRLA